MWGWGSGVAKGLTGLERTAPGLAAKTLVLPLGAGPEPLLHCQGNKGSQKHFHYLHPLQGGAEVTWRGAGLATHNGPWSSRSMWTPCSRSGSRCWTSTCDPQPGDPEPQRRPGDISTPSQGPFPLVSLEEKRSRHHAPFSLTSRLDFCCLGLPFW